MTNTIKSLLFLFSFFLASVSFANNPGVSYQGRIFKPDGTALEGTTVQFRLQVRSPGSENCLLYEEVQTLNMAGSSGIFSITMNDGTGTRLDPATYQVDRIFANRDVMNLDSSRCAAGTSYTPNVADGRKLIVYFKDETMSAYEAMPIMNLNYVPQAMYALESQKVGTFAVTNILRAVDGSGNPVAAPALDPTQLTNLNNLLAGTSTQYATATAFNTVQTFAKSAPPTCSVGEVLKSNGTALSCVTPSASASYSGITAATATNTIDNLNFSQNWNWSTATTQSPMNMSANAITTGSLMSVATSSASLNSTNGLINVANTGASTTGILARFQSNSTVGSGLTVLTNGNVGIGTSTPTAPLEIQSAGADNIILSGNASGDVLIRRAGTAGGIQMLGGTTAVNGSGLFVYGNTHANSDVVASVVAKIGTNTTGSFKVMDDSYQDLFHITGTGRLDLINQNSGIATFVVNPVTSVLSLGGSESSTPKITGSSIASGKLFLDSTTHATKGSIILAETGGNVGIGTSSPTNNLSFAGNIATVIGKERAPIGGNGENLTLSAGGAGSTFSNIFGGNLILSSGFSVGTGTSYILFQTATAGASGVGVNSPSTKMTILGSGNVGIGTTTPGSTLEVNGSSNLNGSVKIGYYGASYFGGNGACKISSQAISTTPNTFTCTGMPASSEVAVTCSGTQAMTTPTGSAIYCRANGISNQVICNTTIANSVAMDWICSWVYLPSGS